jgi:RNA polymerase sigma-70 factor (ECF subfamily)
VEDKRIAVDLRTLPDARLVVLARSGSQPAFQEIVRRYERPVHNLISRIVRDPALAEDVAQEAFLKAFRRLAAFDTGRRFSSWMFRISHNAALDALRRRRTGLVLEANPEQSAAVPVPDPVERAALGQALDVALDSLRPEFRAAIVLRYQEERSYEEIADVMGIPEGTAKTFVHRARKLLAHALAAAGWRP